MKNVFKNEWKPAKGIIIRDIEGNLFAFQFFSVVDKANVLNEGPWAFDGNIILLKELTDFEQPLEVLFNRAQFWIKAIDILSIKQTLFFARLLSENLGAFVGCDRVNLFCAAISQLISKLVLISLDLSEEASESWCKGNPYGYHSNMSNS